ncbi:MAG: hypothetical protein Q3976_01460 [Corynebacterium sp.]|nr:hypothetical protein [Corynebacterium sp.]
MKKGILRALLIMCALIMSACVQALDAEDTGWSLGQAYKAKQVKTGSSGPTITFVIDKQGNTRIEFCNFFTITELYELGFEREIAAAGGDPNDTTTPTCLYQKIDGNIPQGWDPFEDLATEEREFVRVGLYEQVWEELSNSVLEDSADTAFRPDVQLVSGSGGYTSPCELNTITHTTTLDEYHQILHEFCEKPRKYISGGTSSPMMPEARRTSHLENP